MKNKELPFEEITFKFLADYNTHLLRDCLKVNGISIHFRTIRAIYNRAIKEGLTDYGNYPFKLFKIKGERTVNRTLTIHELKAIIDLPLPVNEAAWHWRNVFLLSFYLIGTNLADLLTLKLDNIVDGRAVFRRKKAHKVYSVYSQDPAQAVKPNQACTKNDIVLLLYCVLILSLWFLILINYKHYTNEKHTAIILGIFASTLLVCANR